MKKVIDYIKKYLSVRLSLWIVLFAALIFTGALVYVFSQSRKAVHNEAIKHATEILENSAMRLTTTLERVEEAAKMTQWLVMRHSEVPDSMFVYSSNTLRSNPDFYNCSISFNPFFYPSYGQFFSAYSMQKDGEITTVQRGGERYKYQDYEWYQRIQQNGKALWTDPYLDPELKGDTGRMVISYCMAINNHRGQSTGALAISLSLDWLAKTIFSVKPYPNSYIVMIGADGTFLVHPDTSKMLRQTIFDRAEEQSDTSVYALGRAMGAGKEGMRQMNIDGNDCYVFFKPIPKTGWSMAIVCHQKDIFSGLTFLGQTVTLIFVIGLLLILFVSSHIIARHLQPLEQLAQDAETIASGQFNNVLPVTKRKDEIGQLTTSFANMQQSLVGYMDELKRTSVKKERIESELRIAHDIQMTMLPDDFPQRPGLDIYATMTPAKEVGGDLYYYVIDGDQLFFIIGDVAGKGVPGSLHMAVVCTLFRHLAGNYQSAGNIVREINHAVAINNQSAVFVSLFVGVLDLKIHHLTYCNAGHNPPVLIHPDGTCRFLQAEVNIPVGVEDHYQYVEQDMDFPEETSLLLYTDGLTEANYIDNDGKVQMFGEERVLHDAEKNSKSTAREVVDYLTQHVSIFANGTEQIDDLTLMFIRHATADTGKSLTKRRLIIKNEISEVSRMSGFLMAVCREFNIDGSTAKTLNLALEEWVVNVINYAYPKGMRGHVEITSDFKDGVLTLVVKDHGVAFDPTQHAEVDIDADLADRLIGGLGIHLVRSIMDTLNYERTIDGYNVVTMTKQINNGNSL